MDIGILKEFLALSKTLNYRVAAESLFITQSTLSKHIKALEKDLGAELFNRSTVNVALSESGRTFLEYAKRIVREYDSAREALSGTQRIQGTLKIGGAIRHPVVNTALYPTLTAFEAKYPDVSISAEDIQWQDFRRSLLNGKYDIVFSALLPNLNDEGLVCGRISDVPLCVWVRDDQELPFGDTATLEELSGMTLRILDPAKSETYASYVRGLFAGADLDVKVGKPMTLLYSIDKGEFAPTPAFAPGDFFGSNLREVFISDVEPIALCCFRPRHVSNPITSLFYDEFMMSRLDWTDEFKETLLRGGIR